MIHLARVEVRADLVQFGVVRQERVLRNVVRVRDRHTCIPRLRDVGGHAVLAGDTQADDLYGIQCQIRVYMAS